VGIVVSPEQCITGAWVGRVAFPSQVMARRRNPLRFATHAVMVVCCSGLSYGLA